jgi:hypothetical protein
VIGGNQTGFTLDRVLGPYWSFEPQSVEFAHAEPARLSKRNCSKNTADRPIWTDQSSPPITYHLRLPKGVASIQTGDLLTIWRRRDPLELQRGMQRPSDTGGG